MMSIKNIGVIGSGVMGSGIAHVSACQGFETYLLDLNEDLLQKGLGRIEFNLKRQIKKGTIKESDLNQILDRINLITDYNHLSDCDVMIEAVSENKSIKEKIFQSLDKISHNDAILATNTSSISITELAKVTARPEKVIGMHFMNPVPIMKLVEIIKGKKTDVKTLKMIMDLSVKLDKKPIECNDSPGFVANRILMPMINEAIYCLMENVGTKEAIDGIMHLGMAHPMGPLALADLIGLDVCHDILHVLSKDFNDVKYAPCPLLTQMVELGQLGKKSGKGFYDYK